MWIDCHAHLFDIPESELGEILAEASGVSVSKIISTAVDLPTGEIVLNQCRNFESIFGAAGISPFDVTDLPDDWEHKLRTMLESEKIIAIGEIGIDKTNPRYPSAKLQLPVFKKQLQIAKELNIPAVIHSRGAELEAAGICKESGITKAIFHCFTGSFDAMSAIVDLGFYISISGIVTFPKSHMRDMVKSIPANLLLIETDTPYLAPVPHRGKTNRPAFLKYTAEEIAVLKGIDPDELEKILLENFTSLFGTL
jgi:TatD DNase family protein